MDFIKKIIQNRISKALKNESTFNEMKAFLLSEFERIKKENASEPVAIVRKAGEQLRIDITVIKPVVLPDGKKLADIRLIESISIDL
jgi:uncharacterized alkaline shock family protein YloU